MDFLDKVKIKYDMKMLTYDEKQAIIQIAIIRDLLNKSK
jgi:hypothetical protein